MAVPLAAKPVPIPTIEVRNIAGDWLTFWDATSDRPTPERVAIFQRDVAPKFSAFYAAKGSGGAAPTATLACDTFNL